MAPWFFMEVNVSWELTYVERRKNLEDALRAVKRGAKVFLGTACGEPQYLVEGLIDRASRLHDVQILHFITLGDAPYTEKRFESGPWPSSISLTRVSGENCGGSQEAFLAPS